MKIGKFTFKDIVEILCIVVVILCIRYFIVDLVRIEGKSMYPTLNETDTNDFVLVARYYKYTKDYNYGDIILVKHPVMEGRVIIKRIVGTPNDIIQIKDCKVYRNGSLLIEPYAEFDITSEDMMVFLGEDQYFALGDNRNYSFDSRNLGAVDVEYIVGKAFYRMNFLELKFNNLN